MNNDTSKQRRNRAWCYRSVVELPTALSLYCYSAWFPPTTTHKYPILFHLDHRSPSPVLPTLQPHSPTHTITEFITQFSPFPSQAHTPHHLFPPSPSPSLPPSLSLSPSTTTSHSLHQLHWDPVINNECTLHTLLMLEMQLKCTCYTLIYKR